MDVPIPIQPRSFTLDLHDGKKVLLQPKCVVWVTMESVTFGGAGPGTIRWSHVLKVRPAILWQECIWPRWCRGWKLWRPPARAARPVGRGRRSSSRGVLAIWLTVNYAVPLAVEQGERHNAGHANSNTRDNRFVSSWCAVSRTPRRLSAPALTRIAVHESPRNWSAPIQPSNFIPRISLCAAASRRRQSQGRGWAAELSRRRR